MIENTKQQVREFYDQIGWSQAGEGLYQNARYEDLRPVSREYIHNCHLRVKRHLTPEGELFLDAGFFRMEEENLKNMIFPLPKKTRQMKCITLWLK